MGLEEKYTDEVQKLIDMGKEKGYLLYDEVNEMLITPEPADRGQRAPCPEGARPRA